MSLTPAKTDAPAPLTAARQTPGIAGSLLLHGAVLGLGLAFLWQRGGPPEPPLKPVYVDLIAALPLAEHSSAPTAPVRARAPQQIATKGKLAAPRPEGVRPHAPKPYTDPFELKLQQLGRLRNPDSTLTIDTQGNAADTASDGTSGDAAYSVRDAIRAKVLRKWNLDLGELKGRQITLRLNIRLKGDGSIASLSVEEMAAHKRDLVWTDIAISARNAVLLSAPFDLPASLSAKGYSTTLILDPRDTER